MCDLNQLGLAIQEMTTNPEAAQFVKQVLEEDNIQFLRYITQIWLNPDLPDKVMSNGVTLISVALRPSILQPISLLTEKYFVLSEEERDQIIKAIIRGLMHNDNTTRRKFAYCLSLIVKIERTHDKKTNSRYYLKPTIFDTYLMELLQNAQNQYGQIGSIMAITEILANETYSLNIRKLENLPKLILEVSYQVFDKLQELNEIDIEFKSECAKCIDQALKSGILSRNLSNIDDKTRFLQSLLPNTQMPFENLHVNLLSALARFACMLYDQYYQSFSAETIVPFIEEIYKETIQPVAAIQSDEFNLKETESFARNVIRMWKKFAKKEVMINRKLGDEGHLNLISTIAVSMDQYLFSYISTFQVEDIFDNNPINTISFFAYQCLQSFSKAAPKIVYSHAKHIYESYLQTENRQSVFVSFVAAQIIFQNIETTDEDLLKILNDIIRFTSVKDISIVSSAYAAIITACEYHPLICKDPNFFKYLLQTITNSLQNGTTDLIIRALRAFSKLITPYDLEDEDSNLSEYYQHVIQMLMNVSQRSEVSSDLQLEHSVYFAIYKFLSKLPKSFPNSIVLQFGSQVYEQMQSLIDEHPDGGLQLRAWLSLIVNGITEKVKQDIGQLAPGFLTVLVSTCEEINSTKTNINSHEDVISAINNIVFNTGKLSQPLIPRLLDIAMNGISTQNAFLTLSSAMLIYHLFHNFNLELIDSANDVLNALIDCLTSQNNNNNVKVLVYLYHSLNSIINIGMESEVPLDIYRLMGEMLLSRREDLMNISVNLIPLLENYIKDSEVDACTLFAELLDIFTSIMKSYDYEKMPNPENTSQMLPSPFIAFYIQPFYEIIETGKTLFLYTDEIGFAFCDYVCQIIYTFGTSYQMNVKIHKPGFRMYFKWCDESDSPLLKTKTREAKRIYDHS